jgi:hypothetical protein
MDYRFPRLAYGGPFKALAHTHDMNRGERGVHSPLESAADTRIRRDTEQQVCFLDGIRLSRWSSSVRPNGKTMELSTRH